MYPLRKIDIKPKKQRSSLTLNKLLHKKFEQQFESFQCSGYEISFHLLSCDKLRIQAISLSSLKQISKEKYKKKKQKKQKKSKKNKKLSSRQQSSQQSQQQQSQQQQQSSQSSQQQQQQFSFHYIFEFQLTSQFLLPYQSSSLYTQSITLFYQFIKILLKRYNYEYKLYEQQQIKKYKKNNVNLIGQNNINSIDQEQIKNIMKGFKSKYVEIKQEKEDGIQDKYTAKQYMKYNQSGRKIIKQQNGIKQEYINNYNKLNKRKYLVMKLTNIFQKLLPIQQQQQQNINKNNSNLKLQQNTCSHIKNNSSNSSSKFFIINLKPRLLQSFQFSHRLINYNLHQFISLKSSLHQFSTLSRQICNQITLKSQCFIQQLKSTAQKFQQQSIKNVLQKLNTNLKVKRDKKIRWKAIPEEFTVNGVNATYQYKNYQKNQKNQKEKSNQKNNDNMKKQVNYNIYNNNNQSQLKQINNNNDDPQIQIFDSKFNAVKIPIQFDQQSGSYHQFSISDNVISKNGGNWYQILHFKYRLHPPNKYICTMRLLKTQTNISWLGIMQQQTKYHIHTSQMRNCMVYHTKHCTIQTNIQGKMVKKKAKFMTPLKDGQWVRMCVDMAKLQVDWTLWNGVKTICKIPEYLQKMVLRPILMLYRIGDAVEFVDV